MKDLFFKRNVGGPRRPPLSPTRRTGPVSAGSLEDVIVAALSSHKSIEFHVLLSSPSTERSSTLIFVGELRVKSEKIIFQFDLVKSFLKSHLVFFFK